MLTMQTSRRLQTLLTLLILSALLYLGSAIGPFLAQFFSIFLLFFLAWLLADLLRPALGWLTGRGLPPGLAVPVIYLIGPVVVVAAGSLFLPTLNQQAGHLHARLDAYTERLTGLLDSAQGMVAALGVSPTDIQSLEVRVREQATVLGTSLLQGVLGTVQGIGSNLFALALVLIFSISFLVDGDALASQALATLPARWQTGARLVGRSVSTSFGSFVRGQLLFALAYALLMAALMFVFGLPYILVAAPLAGLLMIVPLVGNYLAYLPPLLVTLVEQPDNLLPMAVALVLLQGLYLNLIGPRIMARAVGMHPLLTTAAILVFGQVVGFWGAFFGIPLAATLGKLAPPTLRLVQSYLAGEDPVLPDRPTAPALSHDGAPTATQAPMEDERAWRPR